MNYVTAVD